MDEAELVAVFTGAPHDAEMLRAALAGSGIEASIQSSGIGGAYPVNVGDLAKTMLLVRAEDADAACDIIAAGDAGMLAPDDTDTGPAIRGAMLALAVVIAVVVLAAFLSDQLLNLVP